MKYFKFLVVAALLISIQSVVVAQNSRSKMDNEKIAGSSVSQKVDDSPENWYYSVAHVIVKGERVKVELEKPDSKPKTKQDEYAMKMQIKNSETLHKAMANFKTETDVLNYFASLGMELVTVLPEGESDSHQKIYYLRTLIKL